MLRKWIKKYNTVYVYRKQQSICNSSSSLYARNIERRIGASKEKKNRWRYFWPIRSSEALSEVARTRARSRCGNIK